MSIKIEIHIPDYDATGLRVEKTALLAEDMAALGFERASPTLRQIANAAYDAGVAVNFKFKEPAHEVHDAPEEAPEPAVTEAPAPEEAPKRKRRTKAEIEADRAAEAGDKPQISTGEERVGPEDDPATQAQDAADEAAEVEANRDAKAPLTRDDLRAAVARYTKKFTLAVAVKQIPAILGCSQAEVPDTQDALAEAIAKVDAATAGAAPPAEAAAKVPDTQPAAPLTKADALVALRRYAVKFDGTDQLGPQTTPIASEDFGQLLKLVFGDKVTKLSDVPDVPTEWAKLVAGIEEMLTKNPFNREANHA